jgi:hypothetical protein
MTTERIDVLAALRQIAEGEGDTELLAMRVHSAVAELIERAGTVANYNRISAPDDEYVEIPRATIDGLIAALARVGDAS